MKLSNEEPTLCLEEWDANEVESFAESKLKYFSFLLLRWSLKNLEDENNINFNEVKLDEEEGRWLDPVFKVGNDLLAGLNADGGSSLRWLPNLEEE